MSRTLRWICTFIACFVLAACGGGGGGGGGGVIGSSSTNNTSVRADATTLNVSVGPGQKPVIRYVTLTVTNMPANGLYVGGTNSYNGIATIDFIEGSNDTGQLSIGFKSGAVLASGAYSDTISVDVCYDQACRSPVTGSPLRVTTNLTVINTGGVSIDRTEVTPTVWNLADTSTTETVTISSPGGMPLDGMFIRTNSSVAGLINVSASNSTPTQILVNLQYGIKPVGVYTDTATVQVCLDPDCNQQVNGSPFTISSTYTVSNSATPEPGLAVLPFASQSSLAHNVVDAEYSKALDAVVMISSWPRSALLLYNLANGTEQELPLNKVPVALSVGPDGNFVAIGHDALVTHVDLRTLGSTPVVKLLNLSSDVSDIVLDGNGYVHVFPATDQWVYVRSINVNTNVESQQWGPTYAGNKAKLHSGGSKIYAANNHLSPDDIERYDLVNGQTSRVGDSPYHGDYPMCGNLWLSEDGGSIYTACGRTFRATNVASTDMTYAGTIGLTTTTYGQARIVAMSQSALLKEIALLEQPVFECQDYANMPSKCFSRVSLYESDFLTRRAQYTLAPVTVSGTAYPNRGAFIFHRTNGDKVLISQLIGVPTRASEFQLGLFR